MENYTTSPVPECSSNEYREVAWGFDNAGHDCLPMHINRPKVNSYDVRFELLYCGICHTDITMAQNIIGGGIYPMVPGHELIGKVIQVGNKVTKFKCGDIVGAGFISDSCLNCQYCNDGDEQFCNSLVTMFNSKKKNNITGGNQDTQTFGGYSASQVLHEKFVVKIPDGIPIEAAAPILCAGITMYDPLIHYAREKPMTVGIIGIGGLGTMGLKLSKALGHKVIAISTSIKKKDLSIQKGADEFVVSTDPESMANYASSCDLILNTISAAHQVSKYIPLLKKSGTIVQLGLLNENHQVDQMPLIWGRKAISGSVIGGIKNTEDCLSLCAKYGIYPEIKLVEASQIKDVFDVLNKTNPDGVRYVIDIKKSMQNKTFLPK